MAEAACAAPTAYRPRRAPESPLYRLAETHHETFKQMYDELSLLKIPSASKRSGQAIGRVPSCGRIGPERGSDGSLVANPSGPEFEEIVVWGARPHPFRTGGLLVNRGPPLQSHRMSLRVRGLARLSGPVSPVRELHPPRPRVTLARSGSLPLREALDTSGVRAALRVVS